MKLSSQKILKLVNVMGSVSRVCAAVSSTGFTGSLDAIGAIPDLNLAVKVMQGLASPTFAKLMVQGKYEVAGVIPVGDAF